MEVDGGTTIADLLTVLNIHSRGIAVELNQEILPSSNFTEIVLQTDDRLEIVTLVGGG
jgi:thiamine biosynthesis protein ThiS